jgi:hypothetical protein
MPIAGPWMKISEALDWVEQLQPKVAFPVHDAILHNPGWFYQMIEHLLKDLNVEFNGLAAGDSQEYK